MAIVKIPKEACSEHLQSFLHANKALHAEGVALIRLNTLGKRPEWALSPPSRSVNANMSLGIRVPGLFPRLLVFMLSSALVVEVKDTMI